MLDTRFTPFYFFFLIFNEWVREMRVENRDFGNQLGYIDTFFFFFSRIVGFWSFGREVSGILI